MASTGVVTPGYCFPLGGGLCLCDRTSATAKDIRAAGASRPFRAGQVIFRESGPAGDLYLLCDGLVKLFHAGDDGRDHILESLAPGAVIGELSLERSEFLSISAQALTDARLLHLPRARVGWLIDRHPMLAVRVAQALSSGLARARRKSRDLALKGALPRLAAVLLSVSAPHHGGGDRSYQPFRYTRRDLAAITGTTTETVIRLLSRLRRRGVVRTKGRNIAVVDTAALRRLATSDASEAAARRSEALREQDLMTGPLRWAVR